MSFFKRNPETSRCDVAINVLGFSAVGTAGVFVPLMAFYHRNEDLSWLLTPLALVFLAINAALAKKALANPRGITAEINDMLNYTSCGM